MKIIRKKDAQHFTTPEGAQVNLFRQSEYSLYYTELPPHSSQPWHHHNQILESHYIIEGELTFKWREGEEEYQAKVHAGDLTESESSPHAIINHTDKPARFLVIKLMPTGSNKEEILKTDKILD